MEALHRVEENPEVLTAQFAVCRLAHSRKPASRTANRSRSHTRRLFTVDDYHRMGEAGILDQEERTELLEGEIFLVSPIGPKHVCGVNRLNQNLVLLFHGQAIVSIQNPFIANTMSEPQPDILLLKMRDDEYFNSLPTADDVLLIVEVADTSLHHDRSKKLKLYGSIGIREYWILNVLDETLECYRVPNAKGYSVEKVYARNQTIAPLAFPKKKIAVKDLLPPQAKK